MRHSFTVYASIILVLFNGLILLYPNSSGSPSQTVDIVDIEIKEDRISVDLSINGTRNALLHCTATLLTDLGVFYNSVSVEILKVDPSHVHLVIEESQFTLTPEDPQFHFTVNVSVDPGTSASLTPVVTIDGTARPDIGPAQGVSEDSASIDILPYFGSIMDHRIPLGVMTIDKGSSEKFDLIIENTGNTGENFILKVDDISTLSTRGISIEFENADVYIEEGGSKTIEVEVKTSSDSARGSYQVKIYCYPESVGQGTEEQSSINFQVEVTSIGDLLEGFFDEPWKLIAVLVAFIVILILSAYGIYRLKQHLAWKRTLERVRSAGLRQDDEPQYLDDDHS